MDPFVLTSKLRDSFSILRLERLKKVHRLSVRHSPYVPRAPFRSVILKNHNVLSIEV